MLSQVLLLSFIFIASVFGQISEPSRVENEIIEESVATIKDLEKEIIEIFNTSVKYSREELNMLRNFINRVKAEHNNLTESVEEYLANPINAFSLIKRMTLDWYDLKSSLSSLGGIEYLKTEMANLRTIVELPGRDELTVAAKEILEMQLTHNLKVTDLVKGIINGEDYGDVLEWDDCFEIGKVAFEIRELDTAKQWFLHAAILLKSAQPPVDETIQKDFELQIIEYLALIDYESGDSESALKRIDFILAEYPEHPAKHTRTYILLNEEPDFFEETE